MAYNIILILSSFLGYVLILLTLIRSKYNRILNAFLLFIIFISSTLLMIAGIGEIYNLSELKFFYNKCNNYTPLFLPCFYLYFKYLIRNQQRFIFKDFTHIIFLFSVIIEREFLPLDSLFDCKWNYFFTELLLIYVLVYVIVIFLLLKKHVWNKKAILSIVMTQNKLIKKWTILLFISIIIFTSRFYFVYYQQYLFFEPLIDGQSVKNLWISALAWIVLFMIILSHPELLYGYSKSFIESTKNNHDLYHNNYWNLTSKVKINNNHDLLLKEKISSKIEIYIFELNLLLYKNTYFVNPDFSIKDLAKVLNIPKSHLCFIFKYHSELSFSDYKKISRIQNSLELINNNFLGTNTLDSLSKKIGFSSYNPFFSCFKEVVGKSPQEYISSIKRT